MKKPSLDYHPLATIIGIRLVLEGFEKTLGSPSVRQERECMESLVENK
jgi:hypothetical protein